MAGSSEDAPVPHSPRTRSIIQHFERQLNLRTEGLDDDVRVTNERLGQLEAAQVDTTNTLAALKTSVGDINTSLVTIMSRLEEMSHAHVERTGTNLRTGNANDEYSADTEDGDNRDVRDHRRIRRNRHDRFQPLPQREVHDNDDLLGRIKFTMPPFNGKYDPDAYLTWELAVEQKLACHDFPENRRVRAATSEFTIFASVWWSEYCRKNPNTPETWDALKRIMRARFVPSYYARDMLNKLQQFRQGTKTVEDYYQQLQIAMLRCGLVEDEEGVMARFMGGLNREIQDILSYKEYNSVTRLFHLACKAEREVQGRRASIKTNLPTATVPSSDIKPRPFTSNSAPRTFEETKRSAPTPTKSSSSIVSTGRTRDIQCLQCKGYGHVRKDCPSKRVLIIREDGGYSSASDLDEDTYTLLAHEKHEKEEHIGAEDAERYESLIVQRVLSAQMAKAEHNQRHNLFHTKCVIKERSCRVIIDGGSCNNLASSDLVQRLALTTKPHPQPYYIQWFNNNGKVKVTRLTKVQFSIGSYHDAIDCDIIPMQACSVLLGRPWQYDKDSLHHGRTNQYSFVHQNKKIVLHPMSPEAILKDEIARASKEKNLALTNTENQSVVKELDQHKKRNPKLVPEKKNEIKLKGAYLKPYLGTDEELESRTTQMQEGEDDELESSNEESLSLSDTHPTSPATAVHGPITRARAPKC
uniref:CCHC-type domain-containing protein n=1 Tax=Kalanchoe fedtschenkoi TaxID=63787 RepID=A0A7N1A7T9_KALFE